MFTKLQFEYFSKKYGTKFEPINLGFYNEYFTYYTNKIRLKDFDKIDVVLKQLVLNHGFNIGKYQNDSLNSIAIKKAKFTEQDLNGFYETYVKNLNMEYRYAIENMIEIKSAKTIGFIIFLHSDGTACVYDEDFSFHVKFSFLQNFSDFKVKNLKLISKIFCNFAK